VSWTLTLNVQDPGSGGGGGIVEVFDNDGAGPDHQCRQARCVDTFGADETILLEPNALGLSVSQFRGWQGACAGQGQQCHLTMDGDKTVTALYVRCPPGGCT